jgi:hypothetical protein
VAVSLFVLAAALLAWRWPVAALVVAAVLVEERLTRGIRMATQEGYPIHRKPTPCPVPGCTWTVVYTQLMCWGHWQYVPAKIKRLVYASWNNGVPLPEHAKYCADAIAACQKAVKVSSN